MKRERPTDPHDRNRVKVDPSTLALVPSWLTAAGGQVADHLRAFAARYPDRFIYENGKLCQKGKRG